MRRFNRILTSLIALILIITSAVSCSKEFDFGFKELCFYHPHTAPVKINVDWDHFRHIEEPTGMTVYVWPLNEDEKISRFVTHRLDSVTLDLKAGFFHTFAFNQSDSEYGTIEFYNLEDFDKAEARVKQTKSSWYQTKNPDTKLGTEPEWLAIDCLKDIEVTEQMVKIAEEEFIAAKTKVKAKANTRAQVTKSQNDVGTLKPKSIIKNVDIYIHIENIHMLHSARAVIKGLAEGCYISSKKTTPNQIAHTVEDWVLIFDEDENGVKSDNTGVIKTSITTFGLPDGHNGYAAENEFYVQLRLADKEGTVMEHTFHVGELIKDMNSYDGTHKDKDGNPVWPELHVNWPEPLPEIEIGSDGGFDIGVGGWGDEIVTEIPLL